MEIEKKHLPNMLNINTLYSFTINPNDTHQFYDNYDKCFHNRIGKVLNYIIRVLSRTNFTYLLYPEISTPMTNKKDGRSLKPRIHVHGFIMFRTYNQLYHWYNEDFNIVDTIGYFDMDTVDDPNFYVKYAQKNLSIMSKILEVAKVDDYTIQSCHSDDIKNKIHEYIASITDEIGNPQVSLSSPKNQKSSSLCSGIATRRKYVRKKK